MGEVWTKKRTKDDEEQDHTNNKAEIQPAHSTSHISHPPTRIEQDELRNSARRMRRGGPRLCIHRLAVSGDGARLLVRAQRQGLCDLRGRSGPQERNGIEQSTSLLARSFSSASSSAGGTVMTAGALSSERCSSAGSLLSSVRSMRLTSSILLHPQLVGAPLDPHLPGPELQQLRLVLRHEPVRAVGRRVPGLPLGLRSPATSFARAETLCTFLHAVQLL